VHARHQYHHLLFNGEALILAFLREQTEQGAPLFVSAVTEHELYSYPHLTSVEVAMIDALLTTLTVIDVDSRIAQLSGQLRATYGIKALDSFIAATALMTGTTLATRNGRDFRRIPNLDIREL
jgi:predicted nucleic acid-binding protein